MWVRLKTLIVHLAYILTWTCTIHHSPSISFHLHSFYFFSASSFISFGTQPAVFKHLSYQHEVELDVDVAPSRTPTSHTSSPSDMSVRTLIISHAEMVNAGKSAAKDSEIFTHFLSFQSLDNRSFTVTSLPCIIGSNRGTTSPKRLAISSCPSLAPDHCELDFCEKTDAYLLRPLSHPILVENLAYTPPHSAPLHHHSQVQFPCAKCPVPHLYYVLVRREA